MLCYRDRTYCGSKVEKHTCNAVITEEELKDAAIKGLPIAYTYYCGEPTYRKDQVLERLSELEEV